MRSSTWATIGGVIWAVAGLIKPGDAPLLCTAIFFAAAMICCAVEQAKAAILAGMAMERGE